MYNHIVISLLNGWIEIFTSLRVIKNGNLPYKQLSDVLKVVN